VTFLDHYQNTIAVGKLAFDVGVNQNLPDTVPDELVKAILSAREHA
jgi:hypothetical protein